MTVSSFFWSVMASLVATAIGWVLGNLFSSSDGQYSTTGITGFSTDIQQSIVQVEYRQEYHYETTYDSTDDESPGGVFLILLLMGGMAVLWENYKFYIFALMVVFSGFGWFLSFKLKNIIDRNTMPSNFDLVLVYGSMVVWTSCIIGLGIGVFRPIHGNAFQKDTLDSMAAYATQFLGSLAMFLAIGLTGTLQFVSLRAFDSIRQGRMPGRFTVRAWNLRWGLVFFVIVFLVFGVLWSSGMPVK